MRIRPPEFETSIFDAKYHVSLSTRSVLGKCVYLVTLAMSLFDLQDVCIAIGSIATLDLPMVVDLIGIYGLKGPYCTLTTTDWFLQALSVIPRGSWGDVARRFTMIRWASPELSLGSGRGLDWHKLPQSTEKSRIIVITVGARHKCQQDRKFEILKPPPAAAARGGAPPRMRRTHAARVLRTLADRRCDMAGSIVRTGCAKIGRAKRDCRVTLPDAWRHLVHGSAMSGLPPPGAPPAGLNPRPAVEPGFPENNTTEKQTKPRRDMGSNPSTESNYKPAISSKNKNADAMHEMLDNNPKNPTGKEVKAQLD
ncbi:hypothetical protein F511_03928 [Dorcoceras hygrometricum]|uniref:Uncharacterized protein n=1 Tax=Dorcoceras hygrometricum TaxID=472368 RepID=A0A2Z7A722_9LAMI|nr:hypothetical protein F511_03928 [Dorcoceras hygrometricum]